MSHTPTPWKVKYDEQIVGPKGNVIASCLGYSKKAKDPAQQAQGAREDNAALIIRAVNAHEAMKAALKEVLPLVEQWEGKDIAYDTITKALALAEGKEPQP